MATRARDSNFSGTDICTLTKGNSWNGPAILPWEISFTSFSSTISGNSQADFKFGDALKCLSPEDYVGPLTGMDFANYADSLTNVHNVERNIQCSGASQANIREITTQINQAKNNCVQPVTTDCEWDDIGLPLF
jgi:hypothetical protein